MRRNTVFITFVFCLFAYFLSDSVFASSLDFRHCFECGASRAHTVTTIPATCTSDGRKVYTCNTCGTEGFIPISKINHIYVTSSVAASCEFSGSSVTSCSMCGLVSATEEIPALGHSYSPQIIADATCTSDGLVRYICDRSGCGHSYESISPALGHLLSSTTVDPSCTVEGSKVSSCSRCNYTETEVIAALGHALTTTITDATCTADGSKVSVCSRCDYTATETIAMFGHDWQETQRIEPTYESDGKIFSTCSRCQETTTETIPALDADTCTHTWVEVNRVEPTYTSSGKVDYECSSCGSTMSDTLPVLDPSFCVHQFEEESRVEPTYDADGMITYKCALCGTSKTVRVPMLTPDTEDPSVLTGLSISFASIFGLYEPIMTTHVTTTSSASEVTQVLTTGVADGAAGVDYEFLAGVFLFLILLYCVLRLFGGVLKQWSL